MFDDSSLIVPAAVQDILMWSLDGIASPGTWLTGAQRVGVAIEARGSLAGNASPSPSISDELSEVAHAVAEAPADITLQWIEELEDRGLDQFTYVETAGVVCRISVIDTVAFGLDATPPPLPQPRAGEPSRVRVVGAERTRAWVPTVGPGHALSSFSAVDEERESMLRLSDALYLEEVVPVNPVSKGGLIRSQIEVLAARTSFLNDCFY